MSVESRIALKASRSTSPEYCCFCKPGMHCQVFQRHLVYQIEGSLPFVGRNHSEPHLQREFNIGVFRDGFGNGGHEFPAAYGRCSSAAGGLKRERTSHIQVYLFCSSGFQGIEADSGVLRHRGISLGALSVSVVQRAEGIIEVAVARCAFFRTDERCEVASASPYTWAWKAL